MIYTLALRYARSILALAKKENALEEYRKNLKEIQTILNGSEKLVLLLQDSRIPSNKKIQMLKNIFANLKLSKNIYNLLQVLVVNNRFVIFNEMFLIFEDLYRKEKNSLVVQVITSEGLKNEDKVKIQSKLQDKFNCEVEIEVKADKSILGGVIARVGSYLFDGSVRNFLTRIKNNI